MYEVLNWFAYRLVRLGEQLKQRAMLYKLRSYPNIHETAKVGRNVTFIGPLDSFVIGRNTYINDAVIVTGYGARVVIGERCAIGYRVSIKAVTHNRNNPCPDDDGTVLHVGKSISIGDECWIGDNVFIREGVSIGNNVIVGANSVVTKSLPNGSIVGGVPAVPLKV